MTAVRFPSMRREVLDALARLSDVEYQRRVWIEQIFPHENFFDDLAQVVHILFDDCRVLPDPQPAIGAILLEGEEIGRLRQLGVVFDQLIDVHGNEPDQRYLDDPRWGEVVRMAALALAAMVRGWGFE